MTIRDLLFPEGEEHRNEGLLQTQWSDGWVDELVGLGILLDWMTPKLHELDAGMDYAGAAVVFLQRHRIELGLKALAHHAGAAVKRTHDLDVLWKDVASALKPTHPDEWDAFASSHREFVGWLAEIDAGNDVFRYPEDKSGARVKRPKFINLGVLEILGSEFEKAVWCWVYDLEVGDEE